MDRRRPKRAGTRTTTKVVTRARRRATATLPLFAAGARRRRALDADVVEAERSVDGESRPTHLSTGLPSLDRALRGGFSVGHAALVAARVRVGATSLILGAVLAALKRGERVTYLSERLREEQLRGRLVILESRVNGHRFRAGMITEEDRLALAAARKRIPWNLLHMVTRRTITLQQVDTQMFSYQPWLVVADFHPRCPAPKGRPPRSNLDTLLHGIDSLARLAREHRVALVARALLARGSHAPDLLELPGVGAAAKPFEQVVLLHRDMHEQGLSSGSVPHHGGEAEARVVRVRGGEVEPRLVRLRFDQRFAGLLEV